MAAEEPSTIRAARPVAVVSSHVDALLGVGLALFASAIYAVLGVGFVLDDWFTLRNAHFDGAWAAAGHSQQLARPGAAVVYAVVFGVVGQHPLVVLAIQAAIGAATAALLVVVLEAFFPRALALGAALLWVLLPNHTSLEVWASAANISMCVLLAVAGTALLLSPGRAVAVAAVVCFTASALCYEAVIPVAAAAILVVPWARRGRPDWSLVVGGAIALGGVALWVVTHWHPDKQVSSGFADLSQAIGAHFGWGIAPKGPLAAVLLVAALGGIAVALARLGLPSLRGSAGPAEYAVVVGLAVLVLGAAPFAKYMYAPLGAGDRFNFVSSIGGALVWAGILSMVWAWRWRVAVAGVVLLGLAAGVSRLERAVLWHRAGHDAVAIRDGVVAAMPHPEGVVVIGPAPIQQQNIAGYLDQSNVLGSLQLAYENPHQPAGLTFSVDQFEGYPPGQRFDIRPVSELRPDTTVEAG